MLLSVVICTYNRAELLKKTVKSLCNQDFSRSDYEILIINNQSTDHTNQVIQSLIKTYPENRILNFLETSQGLSYARNRGVKESKGSLICFLDDDIIASRDLISVYCKFFKSHPQVSSAGGKVVPYFEVDPPVWLSSYLLPLYAQQNLGDCDSVFRKNSFPIGANMCFRSSFFHTYGLFDTNLGRKGVELLAGEEKELISRAHLKSDFSNYVAGAVIQHYIPEKRLNLNYIKRQALGTGLSERFRSKSEESFISRCLVEVFKWLATLVLFFRYLFTFSLGKGIVLVKFRYWVSRGLLIGR
ncbi:glycosyltransferase [Reichenbachiella versicolor]|uniref:glycosyltransferase n=1 Tax=Reichenbachiella versicolor TaxID=1821036 RepID=UPI000D6E5C28|nr:glycosyltransferase [Reichenbachiella versicolor]